MRNAHYSSKQPLVHCEFADLGRAIGVEVYQISQTHWDVSYERLSLNTAQFGHVVSSVEPPSADAIDQTNKVIAHLDNVIAELQQHRARLANELELLQQQGILLQRE